MSCLRNLVPVRPLRSRSAIPQSGTSSFSALASPARAWPTSTAFFFALNEKAGRQGAYVTTEAGRAEVLDIDKPPSPLAGDFLTILALTRDAGAACQTLFR